jgi:hypothetical protein
MTLAVLPILPSKRPRLPPGLAGAFAPCAAALACSNYAPIELKRLLQVRAQTFKPFVARALLAVHAGHFLDPAGKANSQVAKKSRRFSKAMAYKVRYGRAPSAGAAKLSSRSGILSRFTVSWLTRPQNESARS